MPKKLPGDWSGSTIINQLKFFTIMKDYAVIETYLGVAPRVVREFATIEDARTFAELLYSSRTGTEYEYTVYSKV